MNPLPRPTRRRHSAAAAAAFSLFLTAAAAQDTPPKAPEPPAAAPAAGAAGAPAPGPAAAQPTGSAPAPPDEIQLSFQGAEIDAIVKFIAETTGKTVIKHPKAACKVTIMSSAKLPRRDALRQVFRALALEGFQAIETRTAVMIVPEDMSAKLGTEFVDGADDVRHEGRAMITRVIDVKHTRADQLREKLSGLVSDKSRLSVDAQTGKLIVTDHADTVQLIVDLVRELDTPASTDTVTEVIPLRHARAEDLAVLLRAVFGGSPGAGPAPGPPPGPEGPKPEGAAPAAGGAVRFLADRISNRLIVTAPKDRWEEVRRLIETLDSSRPADVAVRVVPLVHVNAKDLVQELAPLYQKLRGESLKDSIEITANSRSNSLVVLSSQANFDEIKTLVASLDTEEAQENAIRVFELRNADAEDVAEQLTSLHEDSESSGYSRYWYYSDRMRDTGGKVRFVADRRKNTVMVIGPPARMAKIADMIEALDAPVEGESLAPKIYPLKFVSAWDVEEVLNALFLKKTAQRGYWYDDYIRDEEKTDIGRLYGKVRIASEPYTNSIIVSSNSPENFSAVEAILKQLDVPSPTGETTLIVPLNHAKSITVANNLNILFAQSGAPPRRQQPQQGQQQGGGRQQADPNAASISFEVEEDVEEETFFPWLGGQQEAGRTPSGRTARPVSDLVGKVRVVPDTRTNSLLITTNSHFFPQVLNVVQELDVPTAQVLIEAKIIEVSRDDRDRLGVRWSPDGGRVFDTEDLDDSIIGTGSASYREVFAGTALADALRTGIVEGNVSLDILVQFLQRNTDSRVKAEPRINVADNERGKLFVGARVPFISGSLSTVEGGRNDTFTYRDVGIILEVTPHINRDGQVTLKIRVESSQIRQGETLFGGAILDTRNYRTDLSVKSGQTLVLGGIIQREESEVVRKIPLLGDIPLLGWYLFTKTDSVERDVELMVFLRTTVTRSPQEVEKLMESEREKTPQIQSWEEEIEEKKREEAKEAGGDNSRR